MTNNFGVYFIFCKNNWKTIFDEQLKTIIESKILSKIQKLFLSINYYDEQDLEYIKTCIKDLHNIKIASVYNTNHYEFEALRTIKLLCKQKVCNVFYMHTKGASITNENATFYHGSTDINHLQLCVRDWRIYMEYHLLYKADDMIQNLNMYDACGVNLTYEPQPHFSGNFWWSKSEYINTLPEIETIPRNFRWAAEYWIGNNMGKFLNVKTETKAGYTKRIYDV